jgi:hypothetical protein
VCSCGHHYLQLGVQELWMEKGCEEEKGNFTPDNHLEYGTSKSDEGKSHNLNPDFEFPVRDTRVRRTRAITHNF